MKQKRPILVVILGLLAVALCVASLFFGMVAPAPDDAARHAAVAKGHTEQQLEVEGYTHSDSYLFGESANIRLNSNAGGNRQVIEVVLKRPMWSPNWQVERYTENGKER